MGTRDEHGFTIIEISLFFAVSGLLLVGMLTGVGLAVQRQRFSDAVNTTQSFIQKQYNETQIVLNDRKLTTDCGSLPSAAKGTSECLVVGKLVDLGVETPGAEESTIRSYRVIVDQAAVDAEATRIPTPTTPILSSLDLYNEANVKTTAIKDANEDSLIVPWGTLLRRIFDSAGNNDFSQIGKEPVRYFLILRSPITGIINTYKIDNLADIFSGSDTTELLEGQVKDLIPGDDTSIKSCFESADILGTNAMLKIKPGGSQDGVITGFDENAEWCNGL